MTRPRPRVASALATRYLMRQLLVPIMLVVLALASQIWIVQVGRLLERILPFAPSPSASWGLMVLLLPPLVAFVLPGALVIGLLYGFHRLRQRNELTVLLATGMRPAQFMLAPFYLALILGAVMAALVFWVNPQAVRYASAQTQSLRAQIPLSGLNRAGRFLTLTPGLTFYAKELGPPLRGFVMIDARNPAQVNMWLAERASVGATDNNTQIQLYQGSWHTKRAGEPLSVLQFEEYTHEFARFSAPPRSLAFGAAARNLRDLLRPASDDAYARDNQGQLRAAGHRRLAAPLQPLALSLLIVAVLFGGRVAAQHKNSWGRRLGLGALAGAAWILVEFSLYSMGARAAWGVVLIYAFPLATMLGAVLVVARPRFTKAHINVGAG